MNDLIKGLQGISAGALLGWIVAIVAATKVLFQYLEKYRTLRNINDDYKKRIADDEKRITSLEDEVKAMKKDYEILLEDNHRNFDYITKKIDGIVEAINGILEYNKNRDKADLKEQIRSKYDVYHEKQSITKNEKESLMDLISSYEAAGGDNSFVHSLVLPEILSLPETD